MKTTALYAALALGVIATPAWSAGDLSRADVETVILEMGSNDNGMYFKPSHLDFDTGKAYEIVLKNPDKIKHEAETAEFAEKVFARKVEVKSPSGELVAEIKGAIREVEVGPGGEVEWFVVPVQTGTALAMECPLEGHREAGMHGTITIN